MKVLINRKRQGKKIVDAPRSIQVYDNNVEKYYPGTTLIAKDYSPGQFLIAKIEFYDRGGFQDPLIMIHTRGQVTVIAYENQKGGQIELKENPQGTARWAEIQPPKLGTTRSSEE